jgi:hypothetical protein
LCACSDHLLGDLGDNRRIVSVGVRQLDAQLLSVSSCQLEERLIRLLVTIERRICLADVRQKLGRRPYGRNDLPSPAS